MSNTSIATLYSPYRAFKNNRIYTGTLTISGTTTVGVNIKTFTVSLSSAPDMLDISFNGPTGGSDDRPSGGWFKMAVYGASMNGIYVSTNNAGGGNPSTWQPYASLNGTTLTITCFYVQGFTTSETLTTTDFSYRIVDYSVF